MPNIRVWVSWQYPWGPRISTYTVCAESPEAAIKEAEGIYASRMSYITRITAEEEDDDA